MTTLLPEEIKSIREFYGLTQKSFAQVLGLGAASIVRYEQGNEPSRANANLIRAARHPEFMKECIERDGDTIPAAQRDNAMRIIYACVALEPENAAESVSASKMDDVYHFTIQQEVLNEQAANLSCDLLNYLVEHDIDVHDKSEPISILLLQLLALKRSLTSPEANDDTFLERLHGHLDYMKQFVDSLKSIEEVA